MLTAPPRRRWLRFTFNLRTMFVAMTIFGVWLGWQLQVVRERKAVIAELRRTIGQSWVHYSTLESDPYYGRKRDDYEYARISIVRRLLGDESCVSLGVLVRRPLNPQMIERMKHTFPEAELSV